MIISRDFGSSCRRVDVELVADSGLGSFDGGRFLLEGVSLGVTGSSRQYEG